MLASRAWRSIERAQKPAKRLCCRGDRPRGGQAMKIDSVEAIPIEIPARPERWPSCQRRSDEGLTTRNPSP
jgi:hypothetical protein